MFCFDAKITRRASREQKDPRPLVEPTTGKINGEVLRID